jgi:hypothetical protein
MWWGRIRCHHAGVKLKPRTGSSYETNEGYRMNDRRYFDHCEEMWRRWVNAEACYSSLLNNIFQVDYCPEPYLYFFNDSLSPLHFLTTNPGAAMPHQNIQVILGGKIGRKIGC